MINSVPNFSYKDSPFNDFALNSSKDRNFFVTKKYEPPKKTDDSSHKLVMTITAASLVVVLGTMALLRGPKGQKKVLNKVKDILEKRLIKSKTGDAVSHFYLCALNKVNSFIEKLESINNFTSLKDVVCKKVMGQRKWTEKLHNKISKVFEKTSRETVLTSWHNTKHKMNKTFTKLEKFDDKILSQYGNKPVTINGITKTGEEWVKILKDGRSSISNILEENSSKNKLLGRYKKIKTATKDLADVTLAAFKDWRKKELYQTFVADRAILKDKTAMLDEMNIFRETISFDRQYKLQMARELIKKVENLAGSKDYNTIKKISQLKADIKKGIPDNKIIAGIEDLSVSLNKSSKKMESQKEITEMLEKAKGFINNKNEGKMEEMMKIYEKLLPEDYAKIQKQTTKFTEAMDKSINVESVQFFDKVRDLQVGSAPTDVITMLAGTGLIGAGLLRADNKDERISVTLKAGIPVIGALATSVYCTARLVSGGKAMVVGLVSGKILNIIGEQVDKFRKKIQERRKTTQAGTNAVLA